MIKKLVVHRLVLCVFFAVFSTLYTTKIWAACTDENGSSYLPTGAITPIELEVLKQNNVITGYQDTNNNKIVDLEAYVQGEEWSVYFPESNKIISGVAVCGPSGKADGAVGKYVGKQLSAQQAYCGCYCKQGTISDSTNYVSVKKLDGGLSGVPNKTNYCRANCPQQCAQLVAESASFRTLLYGGADNCPVGTPGEGGGTEEPGCAKTATDYCDVSSDCEYVLKSAYSVGYTMDSGDDYCVASPNEYSILLSTDGNDILDEVVTVYYGSAISGLPVPTADGMGFVGWFDENGNEYSNGTIYKVADDIILYAKWGCELPVGDAVTYSPTTAVDVMTLAQLRADYPNDFSLDGNNQTKLDTENAMALYNQGQRFSVQYENGWIHGTAFCGPANSVTGDPRDQLTVYQAGKGCWCRYGTEDTKSATGFKWVGTKELKGDIDTVCRAECPSVCAEYTATNSTFRSNLLKGTKCPEMDKNVVQCDSIEGYSAMYNASTGECEYTVIKYTITLDSGESVQVDIETIVEQVDVPSKENYRFGGYYTGQSATGTMIYDENGYLVLKTEEDKKQYLLKNQILYADWIEVFCTDDNGMVVWNGVNNVVLTADLLASGVISKKDSIVENEYDVNDFAAYTADQRWAVYFDEYGLVSGAAFCGPKTKATYGNVVTDIITGESGATVSQAHSGCWCSYGEPVPDAMWVSVGNYHNNGDNWATRTDACRKECPRACATAIATDKNFRTTLYGDAGNCPAGSFDEPILCAPGDYMDNGICVTCPESHPNSVAGSSSQNQCYTSCTMTCEVPTCPDNATCTYGENPNAGNLYYGADSCDAGALTCPMEFVCNDGYQKNDAGTECELMQFNVEYHCNDGSGDKTVDVTYNTMFTPETDVCTRDNYKFIGWTMDGESVPESFQWTFTDNKILTALWEINSVTCGAGSYLSNDAVVCTECTAGNYCPGGTFEIKNEEQGIKPCPEGSVSEKGAAQCTLFVPEFSIKTTPISAGTEFYFTLSAKGIYYIDWGDKKGIQSINKTTVGSERIVHVYEESAETYTIHVFGNATAYNTAEEPVIDFKGNKYIYELQGSLGNIFGKKTKFMFEHTFQDCKNLEILPATLFNGVEGPDVSMFNSTFQGCEKLSDIPSGLFDILEGESYDAAQHMFMGTFNGCTALKNIPSDLFAKVTGGAVGLFKETFKKCTSLVNIWPELFVNITTPNVDMFGGTFHGCSSLTAIPEKLFQSISGGAESLFYSTFRDCTGVTEIKSGLFNSINTNAPRVFDRTFYGCSALTDIPDDLFNGITTTDSASFMFVGTFENCTRLSRLPTGLFANITGVPSDSMFDRTFRGCTGLQGYLTPQIFASLDMNGVKISDTMDEVFSDTGLDKKCPAGTYKVKANFGYTLSARAVCLPCDEGYTSLSDTNTCYIPRKLRISNKTVDETIYLLPIKPANTPVMAFDIPNDGVYYSCLSTDKNRTLNNTTDKKMHILHQDTEYLMYDCTAQ